MTQDQSSKTSGRNPEQGRGEYLGVCPICHREMYAGASVERHHWIPKSRGGKEVDWLHAVCHRKIHSVLTNHELASGWNDPEKLRHHPEIGKFVAWVASRDPEFRTSHRSAGTASRRGGAGKRRRN